MDKDEKGYRESVRDTSVDKFCGKITALFLPYLHVNIPEKEWLRFHGKIEACFREFASAILEEKAEQRSELVHECSNVYEHSSQNI